LDRIAELAIKKAHSGDTSYDVNKISRFINFLYRISELEKPSIVICSSPTEACVKAGEMGAKSCTHIDNIGIGDDSGWTYFYKAMRDIIGVSYEDIPEFEEWEELLESGIYGTLLFSKVAFVVIRPREVILKNDDLHCATGPAISWVDGTCSYFLNGIKVPEWLVMTDSGKILPSLALEEKNVDVQREIIRKVGAERMLKECKAKTLDVFVDSHTKIGNEYKLMEMNIGSVSRKYLYFEHASLPTVFYAQPVHPDLKRALHARAWMLNIGEPGELELKSDDEIKASLPHFVS